MPYKSFNDFRQHTYMPGAGWDRLHGLEKALEDDIELELEPAESEKAEVEEGDMDGYEQEVTVKVVDGDGNVLEFFNGELNFKVKNPSDTGTIQINDNDAGDGGVDVDEDLEFVNGVLTVNLTYGEGDWDGSESDTVQVSVDEPNDKILGVEVKKEDHDILEVQE